MQRFKVPAYRHPDPLRHPVFGDFGNSRWKIEYGIHEAAKALRGDRRISKEDQAWIKNPRSLRMGLWDGRQMRDVDLEWSSKRLMHDLAIGVTPGDKKREITRADRLGSAASGLHASESPVISGIFETDEWNGRLQAPRDELNEIARIVDKDGWKKAKEKLPRINWLVSFSAKLECRGPFIEFAAKNDIKPNRDGQYFPNAELNKHREGHGKLILSRLPGLRILSVDLGHRYAAACVVWRVLSAAELKKEIAAGTIIAGGKDELFLHVRHGDKTAIYRRIAMDKIDGSEHPAPWACIDRQFLIKLPGEKYAARAASKGTLENGAPSDTNEIKMVNDLAAALGLVRDDAEGDCKRAVDDLMRRAMRIATLGLKRHGRAAKSPTRLSRIAPASQ
jgi:hypothetical protein